MVTFVDLRSGQTLCEFYSSVSVNPWMYNFVLFTFLLSVNKLKL